MKILLLGLLFALPARADIVFFDLNFSPKEIVAVKAAAKARGEGVRIFPERTAEQQAEIEKYYQLSHSLQTKLRGCKEPAQCKRIQQQLDEASAKLSFWAGQVKKIEGDELERIFSGLDAEAVRVSTMIFSGHSGGTGQVGGLFGGIVVQQVRQAFDRFPRLLEPVKAMLLWGCYSGTLHSLNGIWQKNFPTVTTWGGFENRSPLGIRESSGRFLKSFLLSEEKLRAAKSLKDVHRVFRSLDLVSELDGTAVVRDMYFTYDEADLVDEMLKRCQAFDGGMMEAFTCYEEGKPGCENPPADHRGALRDIYNYLQKNRHCQGSLKEKYPQLPSLEYLIRLIYLDNVKKNFTAHHGAESASFHRVMEAGGVEGPALADFGKTSRAEDIAAFASMNQIFMRQGFRDASIVDRADWRELLLAYQTREAVTNILGPSFYRSWDESCVPFSWVDPGSREKDSCALSEALQDPLSGRYESQLVGSLAYWQMDRFILDNAIGSLWTPLFSDTEAVKIFLSQSLRFAIERLEKQLDRTELEETRLVLYRQKLAQLETQTGRQATIEEIAGLRRLLVFVGEKIHWAKQISNGSVALSILESRNSLIQRKIAELSSLAQGY